MSRNAATATNETIAALIAESLNDEALTHAANLDNTDPNTERFATAARNEIARRNR